MDVSCDVFIYIYIYINSIILYMNKLFSGLIKRTDRVHLFEMSLYMVWFKTLF